jgi:hypothetical protein
MAGQYKVAGSCQTCPANTFKAVPGDSGCQPCPPGTATLNTSDAGDHDSQGDCRIGKSWQAKFCTGPCCGSLCGE